MMWPVFVIAFIGGLSAQGLFVMLIGDDRPAGAAFLVYVLTFLVIGCLAQIAWNTREKK